MRRKAILWLIGLIATCCAAQAQQMVVRGVVTDSATGEVLPYASVILKGTSKGGVTDDDGQFSFSVPHKSCTLQVSYLGYKSRELRITPAENDSVLHIRLASTGIALGEVTVKPRRVKYRKKGNPAVELVRHVIASRKESNPRNHDYFSYDQYEKLIFAKNEYSPQPKKKAKTGKFGFLQEFVDTLDDGITILPVSEKEKIQSVYYRRSPHSEKQVVRGYKSSGIDEIFSSDGVQQFLGEVFREVDIFKNDIPLFLQRFVSPLSSFGPNYYKYYLLDTLEVSGKRCVDLGFVPFNSETFGFMGHLYVTLDSTYFVQRAVLNVPKKINLNFVSSLTIVQEFERTADSTRLITKDDISVNFKLTERTKGMYARRLNIYTNHSFEPPAGELANVFKESAPVITLQGSRRQTDDFWEANRPPEAAKRNPNSMEKLMARLNAVPAYRFKMKTLSVIL